MKDKVKEIISYISQELLSQESMPVIEKKVINELQTRGYNYSEISEALTFIIKFIEKNKNEKKHLGKIRVFSDEEKFKLTYDAQVWLRHIEQHQSVSFSEFEDIMAIVSSSVRVYDINDVKNLVRSMQRQKEEILEEFLLH